MDWLADLAWESVAWGRAGMRPQAGRVELHYRKSRGASEPGGAGDSNPQPWHAPGGEPEGPRCGRGRTTKSQPGRTDPFKKRFASRCER
jgi:hypothetical protein